jgi:RNA polymerase sigma-70 factor, ECF subfamily
MARLRAPARATRKLPDAVAALIRDARAGERAAMGRLIAHYQQRIAKFIVAETGDPSHCDDLGQIVFVKMVLGLKRLRAPARFEPWLYQIARNVCRDHGRDRTGWRRIFVPFDRAHDAIAIPEPPPEPAGDEAARLKRGIAQLPRRQRELLLLSLRGEHSYRDLARLSRSSVAAVKSRLHRARANLRLIVLMGESE